MADLIVRNLDRSLVDELKKRAMRRGPSAEAEHRAILETALARTRRKTSAQALATILDVGTDEDFARKQDAAKTNSRFRIDGV
jgi:plasmid stability protein